MLDISSLLQMDFFQNFTLYAGKSGLYRAVTSVVILDHEGLYDNFCDFHEGDFVLTNLLYAKDNPERIYPSFLSLMNIGVSAIAIKSVLFSELPEEVIALAEEYHVPIFFFKSIYIEDVILNISDAIKAYSDYDFYEKKIDSFLLPGSNAEEINAFLSSISQNDRSFVCSLYLEYREKTDDFSTQRSFHTLKFRLSNLSTSQDLHIFKYKNGFLILEFFYEIPESGDASDLLKNLPDLLGIEKNKFYVGISEELLPVKKLDISIQRSRNASLCCKYSQSGTLHYNELKLKNLLFPLLDSDYALTYIEELRERISCKEKSAEKGLQHTLCAYVQNHFDIEKTAETLFQHPNTIRYRLNKLKEILDFTDDFQFQLAALLLTATEKHR